MIEWLTRMLPLTVSVIVLAAAVLLVRRGLADRERRFSRSVTMAIVWIVGVIAIVLQLPVDPTLRGQLVSLLGVVLSAAVALGATTLISQALAGVMLKTGRTFRSGDFIEVGSHAGRVTVRALFYTEIQTRTRDLVILPNLYVATTPVRVVQKSGTIISTEVGLGYDVELSVAERLMLEAASAVELQDPFVLVESLGDFTVNYRVGGLLTDTKQMLSTQSSLCRQVLRVLHGNGVEIASPTLMNSRVYPVDHRYMFKPSKSAQSRSGSPEATAFDKADEAESIEELKEQRDQCRADIEEAKAAATAAEADAKEPAQRRVQQLETRLEAILNAVEQRESELRG